MINKLKFLITSVFLLFAFYLNAQITKFNSIIEIEGIIESEISKNKLHKNDVLIVFDIDNTLLKSNQDLGGDLWYNWQKSLDNNHKNKIRKKSCLYQIAVPLLTRMNTYSPVESDSTKNVFNNLSNKYTTIALTSRSPELRIDTERVLIANDLKFKDVKFDDSSYDKYDNDLSYANGIFMTTGKDKGEMLKQLLGSKILSYKYIFFVDDGENNITNMDKVFKDAQRSLYKSFYYTKVENGWLDKKKGPFGNANGDQLKIDFINFLKVYGTPDQNAICNCI